MNRQIAVKKVFDSITIPAGGSKESEVIDLNVHDPRGNFSLQVEVTGSGTLKGEVLLSNDGANFIEPSSVFDIFSGFTATSGPNGDGRDIFPVELNMVVRYMKIRVTETGGANSATITGYLAIQ